MFNTQGNGTFKYNLEQGKAILNYNEEVDDIVKPHLKIIQDGSLIEGLNGSSGLSLKDKKTVEGLQSIENEFNKTIAQYNQVYKQFSEDLMNRKNQLNEVSPYLGKNIRNSSGGIYYVNNFFYVLGNTEKISMIISVWFPLFVLIFANTTMILRINEK